MNESKPCHYCKSMFEPRPNRRIFCSSYCRKMQQKAGVSWLSSDHKSIAPGTVGAIHELRIAADLMSKGYAVFRALSPSCPCDLAILQDAKLLRVECRTGYERGEKRFANRPKPGSNLHDVLAIVYPSGIVYEPPFPA